MLTSIFSTVVHAGFENFFPKHGKGSAASKQSKQGSKKTFKKKRPFSQHSSSQKPPPPQDATSVAGTTALLAALLLFQYLNQESPGNETEITWHDVYPLLETHQIEKLSWSTSESLASC